MPGARRQKDRPDGKEQRKPYDSEHRLHRLVAHSKPVRSSAGNDAEGRLPGPRLWFDGRCYLVARGLLYA